MTGEALAGWDYSIRVPPGRRACPGPLAAPSWRVPTRSTPFFLPSTDCAFRGSEFIRASKPPASSLQSILLSLHPIPSHPIPSHPGDPPHFSLNILHSFDTPARPRGCTALLLHGYLYSPTIRARAKTPFCSSLPLFDCSELPQPLCRITSQPSASRLLPFTTLGAAFTATSPDRHLTASCDQLA
jgi:hypothetical protein